MPTENVVTKDQRKRFFSRLSRLSRLIDLLRAAKETDSIQDIPLLTHWLGFLLMVVSVICISVIILWRFRKKGWI